MSTPFDPLLTPLTGTTLIEANAGTGKTHAIACLVARLVAIDNMPLSRILVVTFTQAACEELKTRIRAMLAQARAALLGAGGVDAFLSALRANASDPEYAARLLAEALHAFDEASVFTIHGFCQKLLHEHAFECNAAFDVRLVADQSEFEQRIVQDAWRRALYQASPPFVSYALSAGLSCGGWLKLTALARNHPLARVVPAAADDVDLRDVERGLAAAFAGARDAWTAGEASLRPLLLDFDGWNGRSVRAGVPASWLDAAAAYFSAPGPRLPLPVKLGDLAASRIGDPARLKKGRRAPAHPFFDECERLVKSAVETQLVYDRRLLALRRAIVDDIRIRLPAEKRERGIAYFDDLPAAVHRAATGPRGDALRAALQARYGAALIDEFQDTDPLQFEIFSRLFDPATALVLIGDPKQSIYSFRSADIFAYLSARGSAGATFGLAENWRSEEPLVRAVNAIFVSAKTPFAIPQIGYAPATAAVQARHEALTPDPSVSPAPMQLWFMRRGEGETKITKGVAESAVSEAVATEIVRLLNGGTLLGARRLEPSDIAVLVRKKTQSWMVREALFARDVPSVLRGTESVWDSHEAGEMQRLIAAIAEPGDGRLVRAALTTDLIACPSSVLAQAGAGDDAWDQWLARFHLYHDEWLRHGVFRMLRLVLSREQAIPRLLRYPDGERRVTNMLHLAELLHQCENSQATRMRDLVAWLARQRDENSPRLDEHQMRLERDDIAVQIVTIHGCKGLQYPVVFAPFLWEDSVVKDREVLYHDPASGFAATLDLDAGPAATVAAEREALAENLRLAYVALTRAKSRCYVAWGHINLAQTSALAYLLHQPQEDLEDMAAAVKANFASLDDDDMLTALRRLADASSGAIAIRDMPAPDETRVAPASTAAAEPAPRRFTGKIDTAWGFSSFSALAVHERDDGFDERTDPATAAADSPQRDDIFSFPAGSGAGTFFHKLLETADFSQNDRAGIEAAAAGLLPRFGIDVRWAGIAADTVERVRRAELVDGKDTFTLSAVAPAARLNELEFHLPMARISPRALASLFAKCGSPEVGDAPQRLEALQFSPVYGFLRGFIDTVFERNGRFYLIDWKSNRLGGGIEDYDAESLRSAMTREYYVLQYHLYVLALDAHLRARVRGYDYDTHFGRVYYLFLRGLSPDKDAGCGIFSDRPEKEFVEEMRKTLIRRHEVNIEYRMSNGER